MNRRPLFLLIAILVAAALLSPIIYTSLMSPPAASADSVVFPYTCRGTAAVRATRTMDEAIGMCSTARWHEVKDPRNELNCLLSVLHTSNCNGAKESLVDCVARFGVANWERLLGRRCVESAFWRDTLPVLLAERRQNAGAAAAAASPVPGAAAWTSMDRGDIWRSQVVDPRRRRYVPPSERTIAPFPPPRICASAICAHPHFPIGFALPRAYFVEKVSRGAKFEWMPLLPKRTPARGPYEVSFDDHELFREMSRRSMFAFTHGRGGYDSMRTYEIIASGSVPFYFDIGKVPKLTMGHFGGRGRELLERVTKMRGLRHILHPAPRNDGSEHDGSEFVEPIPDDPLLPDLGRVNFVKHGTIDWASFNATEYFEIADELLDYAKRSLTTQALASYVLSAMNVQERARRVLIVGRGHYDYLELSLVHGMQELGIETTYISWPKEFLYTLNSTTTTARQQREEIVRRADSRDDKRYHTYGNAFGFAFSLDDKLVSRPFIQDEGPHFAEAQQRILALAEHGGYDLVLVSMDLPHQLDRFVQQLRERAPRTKLAFLAYQDLLGGSDVDPREDVLELCKTAPVFVREMRDVPCNAKKAHKSLWW